MSYTDYDFPHSRMYDSDLRELISKVLELLNTTNELESWKNEHEREYLELKELYDDIVSGDFPESMINELRKWFEDNAFDLVGNMIKFISVGLNQDGYITLTYPDQWNVIQFNTTGLDISTPIQTEYGHLTISY